MLFLALRYLMSRPRQTILTLVGILLGSGAYVVISGMMLGFQVFIVDQLVNNDSHIRISAREERITARQERESLYPGEWVRWIVPPSGRRDDAFIANPSGWMERLSRDERVFAYSPQLTIQVLARRGKQSVSARMIGSDPARQSRVTTIEKYMLQGSFRDIGATGNRIIVGRPLLDRLGARVSETLLLASGQGTAVPFRIVGSFELGIKSLDETVIFGSLADTQALNQTPSRISDIAIRLQDVALASETALNWAATSVDKVQSWDQANDGILSVFKTQDIVRNAMTISILIVAGFGIYNILSMTVSQKRREIAILRSIGYEPRDIVSLFLTQGVILGAVGGLMGALVGYLISLKLATVQVSPNRGLGTGTLMMSFDAWIYVRAFALAFVSSSVASLLPARAAGKLTPIDIIRSEGS